VDGFFVPSAVYRELRRPQDSKVYRLLERELELSKQETESVRRAEQAANRVANANQAAADLCFAGWKDAVTGLELGYRNVVKTQELLAEERLQAASRPWYESPVLWLVMGAAAVIGGAAALKGL
jgi:hypothetical protein